MTKTSTKDTGSATLPDAREVATFLKNNLQFFEGRDDLLSKLSLPHGQGHSVSLVEKQVSLLREKNIEMRRQLNELVAAAKVNDDTFNKSRKLVLAMLDAEDPAAFFSAIETCLRDDFKCIDYRLIIFGNKHRKLADWVSIAPLSSVKEGIPGLVENKKPMLGVLRNEEREFIFAERAARVKSAAISPLGHGECEGILALGNKDPRYFDAGMGTLFLGFIVEVISRLLPKHIEQSKD